MVKWFFCWAEWTTGLVTVPQREGPPPETAVFICQAALDSRDHRPPGKHLSWVLRKLRAWYSCLHTSVSLRALQPDVRETQLCTGSHMHSLWATLWVSEKTQRCAQLLRERAGCGQDTVSLQISQKDSPIPF